jgi:tagatose 6-phosphate kinase
VILTVTLNAALDLTYRLERISWNHTNSVDEVVQRAGGKGINVARILSALGVESVVTGLVGGATGDDLRADLARANLSDALVPIGGETRRTVAIVSTDGAEPTLMNEPGPRIEPDEWQGFCDRYRELVAGANMVVLSGSLPPGLSSDAYAILGEVAAEFGVPVVLDTSGAALRHGIACRPELVKPNIDELGQLVGHELSGTADLLAALEGLRDAGAAAAVVSLGADGLLASTPEGRWRASPYRREEGNSTGAGDAVVAGLTLGLVTRQPWPERLTRAVALGAAAVCSPVAGDFDGAAYEAHVNRVRVEAL